MHSSLILTTLLPLLAHAAFDPSSKTNVATYWGQGANQDRLLVTCQNPAYDIINIGFVDVFPDQGPGGYPGTNFGNACWGDVYQNAKGVNTTLLKTCPYIGPDVIECQQTYGKKIFLSIGGGYPTNYYIKNAASGQKFADFLWAAFGPASAAKANIPRPWGDAGVDGFDFDIENLMSPAPQPNYQSSGYVAMINRFKKTHFPQDTTKSYYISGAPQCPIPDSHLSTALASAWFDFFFIQFYNTPQCSARAAIQKAAGNGNNDISYGTWTTQKSLNPNVKMYIGLPGSKTAAIDPSYYLTPAEVQKLITRFFSNVKFGGIMVWEATAAQNQTPCGVDYGRWMKAILLGQAAGKPINTNTQSCAGAPSSSKKREIPEVRGRRVKRDYTVSYCEETATKVYGGQTSYETYTATHTIYPTMPDGYYIPSTSAALGYASSSAAAAAASSVPAGYPSASEPAVYASSAPAPTAYASVSAAPAPTPYASSAAGGEPGAYPSGSTLTLVNTVTVPSAAASGGWGAAPAPYPVGGNSTVAGTASASAAWPSATAGWGVPATGGAGTQVMSFAAVVAGVIFAVLLI